MLQFRFHFGDTHPKQPCARTIYCCDPPCIGSLARGNCPLKGNVQAYIRPACKAQRMLWSPQRYLAGIYKRTLRQAEQSNICSSSLVIVISLDSWSFAKNFVKNALSKIYRSSLRNFAANRCVMKLVYEIRSHERNMLYQSRI